MNPITGNVTNLVDTSTRNYNTQLIPLKSEKAGKGQK